MSKVYGQRAHWYGNKRYPYTFVVCEKHLDSPHRIDTDFDPEGPIKILYEAEEDEPTGCWACLGENGP